MAEKQFARSGVNGPDVFADDDPLAELARIVGFEPKPVAANTQRREPTFTNIRPVDTVREPSPEAAASAQKPPHPIYNLEDELLREFELYDAPRNDNVATGEAEAHLDVVPEIEQTPAGQAAVGERQEPQFETPVEAPAVDHADAVFTVEPFEVVAVEPVALHEPHVDRISQDQEPSFEEPVHAAEPEQPSGTEFDFDLASELEMAIGRAVEAEAPAAPPKEPVSQAAFEPVETAATRPVEPAPKAPFRSLATNFNVHRPAHSEAAATTAPAVRAMEERPEKKPAVVAAVSAAEPAAEAPRFDDVAIEWDRLAEDLRLDSIEPEVPQDFPRLSKNVTSDELLDDISRYPVPEHGVPEVVAPTLSPEKATDARPAASRFEKASEPAFTDSLDDSAFELDFSNIERELAEMSFEEVPVVAAERAPRPEAMPVTKSVAKPVSEPALGQTPVPQTVAAMPGPVQTEAHPIAPPPAPEPPAVMPAANADGELPFDPSLITDAEEHPETVPHLDVPSLPAVEPEQTIAPEPEYDIDIDAEMASLFAPVKQSEPERATPATAEAKPVGGNDTPAAVNGKAAIDEFDEFERALEEDFRRAMGEPQAADQAQPMILGPGSYLASEQRSRRLSRRLVAGVAVAVIGMAGVAGAYSYLASPDSGASASSAGPRIIAADTDPVKIVPENPGGKKVPNQDKAVYDRVAGNAAEGPKQDSLLSSTEEPVDVVQRTLGPESLPLEGGEDAVANMPTPVGDTQDERLLSNGDKAANGGTSQAEASSAVAPRKVRTMIVKADGTLVPRDSIAEPEAPVAEAPAKPALAEPVQDQATAPDARLEQNAAPAVAAPDADMPLRTVRTTKVEAAPVPESRPAEQPVNVVGTVTDRGNVKPAETPAQPEQQVAAVPPGGYVMQVASLPSEADAKRSYANLSKKFGNVIGGYGYEIKKAEIAGKGTYYRVRIPVGSKDDAAALCVKYRAAGGTCLISK